MNTLSIVKGRVEVVEWTITNTDLSDTAWWNNTAEPMVSIFDACWRGLAGFVDLDPIATPQMPGTLASAVVFQLLLDTQGALFVQDATYYAELRAWAGTLQATAERWVSTVEIKIAKSGAS